jgi:hypothetical protein
MENVNREWVEELISEGATIIKTSSDDAGV